MRLKYRSVIIPIVALNVFIFILQLVLGDGFTDLFVLKRGDLFLRPYTLITSMFLHADIMHIAFNMFILFMFGPILEQRIGPKRVLIVYFVSGIIASVFGSFVYSSALGASAGLMGIMGALAIILPNLRVYFFFFVPMRLWVACIIIAILDFFGMFGGGNVANFAHIVGLIVGVLIGILFKNKIKTFTKQFESKTHMDDNDIDEYLRSGRI